MPCTHDVIQSTAQSASIDGCMSRLMVCQIASVRSLAASSPYILFTSSRPSDSPLAPRVISHSVQYLTNNVKPSHLLAPSYLSDPLRVLPANQNIAVVIRVPTVHRAHLRQFGDRAFYIAATHSWNDLPRNMRTCDSLY